MGSGDLNASGLFCYEKVLAEVLGDYYEDVKNFFHRCIKEKHEYKVFMSRRCFVLYQLFSDILQEGGEDITQTGQTIITDKGCINYRAGLKDAKKVLLIDDILIYGRTIEKVYSKLREWAPTAEIDVFVYVKNSGRLCIKSQDLLNSLKFRFIEETNNWREFSNKLVYCIYSANMPYTSFVNSYYNYVEESEGNIKKILSSRNYYEVTNRFQKKYNLTAGIYFPGDLQDKYPLFHTVAKKCCVRVYYNSEIKKFLLIPYVFLKEIPMSCFEELCAQYASLMPEFKKALLKEDEQYAEDMASYKARLLTCIFSYIYGILLFSEKGIEVNGWQDDRDTVLKSFDIDIMKALFNLSVERMQEIASKNDFMSLSVGAAIQTWYTEEEKENIQTADSMQEEIYTYFRMEGDKDELLAREKKDRTAGSTIGAVLDFYAARREEDEIYAYLINAWDAGYASFDWGVTEDKMYLAGINLSGEQSFRQIIEKYPLYFYDVSVIYNKVREKVLRGETFEPLSKEFTNKVEEYCKFFCVSEEFKEYILRDKEDFRKFMVRDIYNTLVGRISETHIIKWVSFCQTEF